VFSIILYLCMYVCILPCSVTMAEKLWVGLIRSFSLSTTGGKYFGFASFVVLSHSFCHWLRHYVAMDSTGKINVSLYSLFSF
jgi:hypothetical protein